VTEKGRPSTDAGSIRNEHITPRQYLRHQRRRRRAIDRNTRRLFRLLRPFHAVPPLLDIGVGVGIGLRALADLLPPGAEIHGLDVDPEMISLARRQTVGQPHLTLHIADAQQPLPFADGHFGIIHSEYVWHHLQAKEAALREARRVLAPDGCFALIDIDPANPMSRLFRWSYGLLRRLGLRWTGGEGAYFSILHAPPFSLLDELLDQVGLTVVYRERRRIRQLVIARQK